MRSIVVLLGVLLSLSICMPNITPSLLQNVGKELKKLDKFYKTAQSLPNVADISVECALCGIVVNEIEGFFIENITVAEIEKMIDSDICAVFGGTLAALCDDVVSRIPDVLNRIENRQTVDVICISYGYCTKPIDEKSDPQPVPIYKIDLDLPPVQRFVEVCSNPQFISTANYLVNTIINLLPRGEKYFEAIGKVLNEFYFPQEYAQEIQGCSSALGISYGWVTLLNLGYEVSDACTSILAQTDDGRVLHVRNMDFWAGMGFTGSLKDICYQADYQKNGKPFFHATTFAGYVGILSGMKPGAFSISIDTRNYPQGIGELFYEVIAAIIEKNASLVSFLTRDVMMRETDFEAALQNLSTDELIADVYYILGGAKPGQGAVITRNRINATDIWRLDPPTRWYEVETNYDHWKQPPWFDDRIKPANTAMDALGRSNLTLDALFTKVLSVKPVLNLQSTFSMLSCSADGSYTSYTRYCQYPCVE
jgi:hypothetical protein